MNFKAHEAPSKDVQCALSLGVLLEPSETADSTTSHLLGDLGLLDGGYMVAGLGAYSTLPFHPGLGSPLF